MAPFDGAILALQEFDDVVFKDELVGSGVGLRPDADATTIEVHAPITGTVIKTLPHAFIILEGSVGVLVHIGIDTVKLDGEGFVAHIQEGQTVSVGDLCYEVDAAFVRAQGFSMDTPVVVMDSPKGTYHADDRLGKHIARGQTLLVLND